MYYSMNENEPVEGKEVVEGDAGDQPIDQTNPPVDTLTAKVHWPGNP
jgi:hypothetical protein